MMRWLRDNVSYRAPLAVVLLLTVFLAGNITLFVAWLLWGG